MAEKPNSESKIERRVAVALRTFAQAPISKISRWEELEPGVGICRITVLGEAMGPVSSPPHVTFYVKDGGFPERGKPLRANEARRCVDGLRVGDVVRLIGDVGSERVKAGHQEIVVTEEVARVRRAPVEAEDVAGAEAEVAA